MAAHEPNPAREARTGLLTLVVLLGTATMAAVLSGISWQKPHVYRVGFRVHQDATGVKPGTPVTLGGIQWGKVTRVQHGEVPASGNHEQATDAVRRGVTRGTLVTFELDPLIRLMPSARISRNASFLGGGVELVITETGINRGTLDVLPLKGRDAMQDESVIAASSPPDASITLLGRKASARLESIPATFAVLKAKVMLDALAEDADGRPTGGESWKARIETVRAAWADLQRLFDEPTPGRPTLAGELSRARNDLPAAWNDASASIQDLGKRVQNDWETRGTRLWDAAMHEWSRLQDLWARCKPAGVDTIDSFNDFMANSSLMGGQIRITFQEPIKTTLRLLFGKPGESGMTRMRRYEAASRLAIATADMREASDALEWLANAAKPVDPALANELRARAARTVEAFQAAIERLVQLSEQP